MNGLVKEMDKRKIEICYARNRWPGKGTVITKK